MNTTELTKLRMFFRCSALAFDLAGTLAGINGGQYKKTPMHELHEEAYAEVMKEEPDMVRLNILLAQMELQAELQQREQRDYPKGGEMIKPHKAD